MTCHDGAQNVETEKGRLIAVLVSLGMIFKLTAKLTPWLMHQYQTVMSDISVSSYNVSSTVKPVWQHVH